MSSFVLEAELRDKTKKEACGRYRREGKIPAVMYGGEGGNTNILIDYRVFSNMYSKLTKSTIIKLKIDKKDYDVLIKDYDKDYVKNIYTHIDFYKLSPNKSVTLSIPLEFVGTAQGVRDGGVFEKHLTSLVVSCLPKDIVTTIKVDISELKVNDSMHVKDIVLSKDYKIISNAEEVVVKISIGEKDDAVATTETTTTAAAPTTTETKN